MKNSDFKSGHWAELFSNKIWEHKQKWQRQFGQLGENYISPADINFPSDLRQIFDPPLLLFYKGNLELLKSERLVTIVGSRKISSYHQYSCQKIIADISPYHFVVVSGLAYGMDAVAHWAALKNNLPTIAVLGSGLGENILYPQRNLLLAQRIVANGGLLLSEYPDTARPQLHYFAKRNRILSGLSKLTIVMSGAKKSGTLITAQCALDQNREVMAMPGNINQFLSAGPNELIKNGAMPLLGADDILRVFHINDVIKQAEMHFATPLEAKIYDLLHLEPMNLEMLAKKMSLGPHDLAATISKMELAGSIRFSQTNFIEIT